MQSFARSYISEIGKYGELVPGEGLPLCLRGGVIYYSLLVATENTELVNRTCRKEIPWMNHDVSIASLISVVSVSP